MKFRKLVLPALIAVGAGIHTQDSMAGRYENNYSERVNGTTYRVVTYSSKTI